MALICIKAKWRGAKDEAGLTATEFEGGRKENKHFGDLLLNLALFLLLNQGIIFSHPLSFTWRFRRRKCARTHTRREREDGDMN